MDKLTNKHGAMLIDGIFGSAAIDTSGEQLDISGCDISSLEKDGVFNWEHRGDADAGASANDVVGRIIKAKKILKESDCSNDRERGYWATLKLPFIYGIGRLFNAEGHKNAEAIAAILRDSAANDDSVISFSVEGSTLTRSGNKLLKSIIRRVAITIKAANKSAVSGVLEDPGAKVSAEDETRKHEGHPAYMRLGGHEFRGSPIFEEEAVEPQPLDKGMKGSLGAAAAVALASSAAGQVTKPLTTHAEHHQAPAIPAVPESPTWTPIGLDHQLHPIAHLESQFGENMVHQAHSKGEFHTALGAVGLKPVTAHEEFLHNHQLRNQNPSLRDPNKFLERLKTDHHFYNALASSLWSRLSRSFGGDLTRAAYAWRWGKGAALQAQPEQIANDPYVAKYQELAQAPIAKAAYTAGGAGAAPGALTNGAALMREDLVRTHLNGARAALRDWDKSEPIRAFLKHRLPEADPAFIEHFAGMVDDFRLKKGEDDRSEPRPSKTIKPPKAPVAEVKKDRLDWTNVDFDEKRGQLIWRGDINPKTGKSRTRVFQAWAPNDEHYKRILNDPHLHGIIDRANNNITIARKLLERGHPLPGIVRAVMINAGYSANESVPMQEFAWGHTVDMMNETGYDPSTGPLTDDLKANLRQRWAGRQWPKFMGDWYSSHPDGVKGASGSLHLVGKDNDKLDTVHFYHSLEPRMMQLLKEHGPDGLKVVEALLADKRKFENWKGQNPTPGEQAVTFTPEQKKKLTPEQKAQLKQAVDDRSDVLRTKYLEYPGAIVQPLAVKTLLYGTGMTGASNLGVPDTHGIRHSFNIHPDQTKDIKTLKLLLLNAANFHALKKLYRWQAQNHPAFLHARDRYFGGKWNWNPATEEVPPGAFIGFWNHWATIRPHELALGRPNDGMNSEAAHDTIFQSFKDEMRHKGVPGDEDFIIKSEDNEYHQMPMAHRVAAAMETLRSQYGEVPALLFFWTHGFRAIQADHNLNNACCSEDPQTVVRKFEAMHIELLHALHNSTIPGNLRKKEGEDKQTKVKFAGKEIVPGRAALAHDPTKSYYILHEDDSHYYVAPEEDGPKVNQGHVQKWPKALAGPKGYNILQPLVKPVKNVVDSTIHTIPEYTFSPEQHALVHGMKFNTFQQPDQEPEHFRGGLGAAYKKAFWMKAGNGYPAYVKVDDEMESPKREVLYHNLAHKFFGLGHYIPTTALIKDPTTGRFMSVQEGVPYAEHLNAHARPATLHPQGQVFYSTLKHHNYMLKELGDSGELDKLALMNKVLGNEDRHLSNFLMTTRYQEDNKPRLQLIDHGHAFDRARGHWPTPAYLDSYHHNSNPDAWNTMDPAARPMHPAALAWVKSLDPAKLKELFEQHHAQSDFSHRPLERMKNLQQFAGTVPFGTLLRHIL